MSEIKPPAMINIQTNVNQIKSLTNGSKPFGTQSPQTPTKGRKDPNIEFLKLGIQNSTGTLDVLTSPKIAPINLIDGPGGGGGHG
jgi:hypothetical protein